MNQWLDGHRAWHVILAIFAWLALSVAPAGATTINDNHLLATAAWYSDDPESTLAQAQAATFKPYQGILSEGYRPGATWVRLTVAGKGSTANTSPWVVWIRPTFLNDITLYDPLRPSTVLQTGDAVKNPSYLVKPTNLGFEIPAAAERRDIYLKLVSTSSHLLDIQVLSFDAFLQADGTQTLWHGMFFGVVGLILVWALIEWFSKRDALIGRFLVKHVAVTLYCLGYLGYWAAILPGAWSSLSPDLLFSYSIFFLVWVALRFHVGVLRDYGLSRWPVWLCQMLYVVPFVSLLLAVSDQLQPALALMSLTTLVGPVMLLLVILLTPTPTRLIEPTHEPVHQAQAGPWARSRESIGPLSKGTLLIYYGVILLLLGLGATQVLGLYQGNEFVLHAFLFHSVISSMLLMTMLLSRSRDLHRRQIVAIQRAASVEGELIAERVAREDQSRLMEMLGHEIKTPLTVLQLAVEAWIEEDKEKALADRSIQEIRAVVNRSIASATDDVDLRDLSRLDLSTVVAQQVRRTPHPGRFQCELIASAHVTGIQVLVEQMVMIYLDNASKYGASDRPIRVSVSPSSHIRFGQPVPGFELRVINPIGHIGKPDPDMVFKRFYRSEGARQLSGTGIGLFLVQTFARIQSGDVDYRPTERDVEFALWLPS